MAPPSPLTRRRLLVAGGAGLLTAGTAGLLLARSDGEPEAVSLYKVFQADQPVGRKIRLPLALAAFDGSLDLEDPPDTIAVRLVDPSGAKSATATVRRRATGIPRAYYPVFVELSTPGEWALEVRVGGQLLTAFVYGREATELPLVTAVGDLLPRIPTPTLANGLGVNPICTRLPSPCPFHGTSLDAALAGPGPVVLLVSTPAHCQTAICGPVLELLIDRGDSLTRAGATVIHAEVYTDDSLKTLTTTVDALGLTFEPSLFVAHAGGEVVARLDYTFDATELDETLASVLGG